MKIVCLFVHTLDKPLVYTEWYLFLKWFLLKQKREITNTAPKNRDNQYWSRGFNLYIKKLKDEKICPRACPYLVEKLKAGLGFLEAQWSCFHHHHLDHNYNKRIILKHEGKCVLFLRHNMLSFFLIFSLSYFLIQKVGHKNFVLWTVRDSWGYFAATLF